MEESLAINHELNIRRRTCVAFIPRSSSDSDQRCGCNRLRREHSWDVGEGDTGKWSKGKHTQPALTNAWGYLPNSQSRFIRCDVETEPKTLARLMFDYWKMPAPRLLMCIIGGAKYFKLNERLEREFIKGIIQAALKAGQSSWERKKTDWFFEVRCPFFRRMDRDQRVQNGCCAIGRRSDSRPQSDQSTKSNHRCGLFEVGRNAQSRRVNYGKSLVSFVRFHRVSLVEEIGQSHGSEHEQRKCED